MPKRVLEILHRMWPYMNEIRGSVLQSLEKDCHAVGQGLWFAHRGHPTNRRLYNDMEFHLARRLRDEIRDQLHEAEPGVL